MSKNLQNVKEHKHEPPNRQLFQERATGAGHAAKRGGQRREDLAAATRVWAKHDARIAALAEDDPEVAKKLKGPVPGADAYDEDGWPKWGGGSFPYRPPPSKSEIQILKKMMHHGMDPDDPDDVMRWEMHNARNLTSPIDVARLVSAEDFSRLDALLSQPRPGFSFPAYCFALP